MAGEGMTVISYCLVASLKTDALEEDSESSQARSQAETDSFQSLYLDCAFHQGSLLGTIRVGCTRSWNDMESRNYGGSNQGANWQVKSMQSTYLKQWINPPWPGSDEVCNAGINELELTISLSTPSTPSSFQARGPPKWPVAAGSGSNQNLRNTPNRSVTQTVPRTEVPDVEASIGGGWCRIARAAAGNDHFSSPGRSLVAFKTATTVVQPWVGPTEAE
ncbi:hypothetical protein BJV74DRAFT_796380 [Russula compacta]|nr:hypothetical protein BJV74DRAFT_796380 [Russula compacta]